MRRQLPVILIVFVLFAYAGLQGCMPDEQPVTGQEAARIAGMIEGSIAQRNPKMLDNMIDVRVFAGRVAANTGTKVNGRVQDGLKRGLANRRFGAEIVKSIGPTGNYRLLRHYQKAGKWHLLFRMYGEQGISYQDFELVKTGTEIKAADVLNYYTGELLSETIGNFMTDMPKSGQTSAHLATIRRVRKLMDGQDFSAARDAFNRLPPAIRTQKLSLIINVQICSGLDDDAAYLEAIEEYQRHYPQAANVPLLMIDAYFLNNDYPKALEAVDMLDKQVGTDPFLDYYRALVYKLMDDMAQYAKHIGQVYRYEPGLQDIAFEMINASLMNGDQQSADEAIAAYRANPSFNQALLDQWLAE